MQIKGKAIFEFVDVNTGEKRVEERDNFIFTDRYIDLFQGGTVLQRVGIASRGSSTYPILIKFQHITAILGGYTPDMPQREHR